MLIFNKKVYFLPEGVGNIRSFDFIGSLALVRGNLLDFSIWLLHFI